MCVKPAAVRGQHLELKMGRVGWLCAFECDYVCVKPTAARGQLLERRVDGVRTSVRNVARVAKVQLLAAVASRTETPRRAACGHSN